jgi:spermidine synthase
MVFSFLHRVCLCLGLVVVSKGAQAEVIYETTSAYHHIIVTDYQGLRTLYFDNALESRMSLSDPLKGHFEYTEFFHLPWLWNERITNVLMIGLGGGSVARAYQHYHTNVLFEVVELDPKVVKVAKDFFFLKESPTLRVEVGDGRIHLRRSRRKYDLIILDAYTANRYGSFIPYSLATKEFFALASDHLTDNGVLAYNVIATLPALGKPGTVATFHHTLSTVFPQIYHFRATTSANVVLVATRSSKARSLEALQQAADALIGRKAITVPGFKTRLQGYRDPPTLAAESAQVLSDDFTPIDALINVEP